MARRLTPSYFIAQIICTFASCLILHSQPLELDMNIFSQRREKFMSQLDSNAVAIFPSKPEYQRNLDVEYEYRQESNFYYLSGFEEPESIILLIPSAPKNKYVLYVRKRDPRSETYEGPRAGVEGAVAAFKADTALYFDDFEKTIWSFIKHDRPIYYTFGINSELDGKMTSMLVDQRSRGDWPITDPAPILHEMRLVKNEGDWKMGMLRAIEISCDAHIAAMPAVKPGMFECEIQAIFESVFRKEGSPRNGYPCIVGSGSNSTILHYSKNNRKMNAGEVLLTDCAAEYGYYSADITRTVPVNGKFSKEQRAIYQIVLNAQNAAIDLVRPGVRKAVLDEAIDSVLSEGLMNLGFIKEKKDFRIFSLHGYSHWIGLEVHDVGAYTIDGQSRRLEAGMIFTVEPGLYVRPDVFDKMKDRGYTESEIAGFRSTIERYMNIGVRIEDDIMVTEDGHKNLSERVPREMNEIESHMRH